MLCKRRDASFSTVTSLFPNGENCFQTENGSHYTVTQGWRCRKSWQPSVKTVNYRGRVDEQRQS
ncbi:MAG: hypothetical protein ACFCUV_18725 [Rivularia sp. (in: cyanobacteria)]